MEDSFHYRDYTEYVYSSQELKDIISSVLKRYAIDKAYLFGSYARGEARPDSDVDLAVCVSPEVDLTEYLLLYDPLIKALQKSVDIFDVSEFIDKSFMKGAVEIYDRYR